MNVKKQFLVFYRLSNITVSCFLEYDLGSILTKSHKPHCDESFICGDDTRAKKNFKIELVRTLVLFLFGSLLQLLIQ